MAILSGDRITLVDLPPEDRLATVRARPSSVPPLSGSFVGSSPSELPRRAPEGKRLTLREYREHAERQYILETLHESGWNISRAAVKLGVERTNLHKKMRGYGIKREDYA